MTDRTIRPFHLAFPVDDLEAARGFYKGVLGCGEGRSSPDWVDFDFHGHQIVAHLAPQECGGAATSAVDGHGVPVRHFGLVMAMDDWQGTADRLTEAGIKFVIEPYVRFKDQPGEQATMFFTDPAGNAIELKSFRDMNQLFAK
ncbi:VOC family protein [Inquilinus sp. CAU 1745]|uniref:VOC family protein n=1 Tax=Inquilinus sp. CAU 1745 TaxID=3140369 RepID=UPI00325B2CA4